MELLDQKGTDLLSGRKGETAVPTAAPSAISDSTPAGGFSAERLVTAAAVVVALIGVYLFFHDLALTGLTWDEWMDYGIGKDFVENQSFLTNHDDPSQARFSHIVAAGSFALLGESYFAFKLPFVLAGLTGGIALWWLLAGLVRPVVVALSLAMYFSCPYVLAASRTGATAGDALVLLTTMGFVITLYRWLQSGRYWPHGLACGVCCGLAIGSKWTSAVLLGAVGLAWLIELIQKRRQFWNGQVWTSLLAHQWVAVGVAVFASPTLMLGVPFVRSALAHSLKFTGMALLQFGELRASAPWYYVPAVLLAKYSTLQLLVFFYELSAIAILWAQQRKKIGTLPLVCLLSLLPMVPLATKGFQNAHYYVATIPAVMIFSALALDRWLRSPKPAMRRWALALGACAMVVQLGTAIYLSPDYLLAGRQFGKFFYGQFAGPAVNHCQGLPFAIREINRAIENENGPRSAYILHSCLGVMDHAREEGPIKPQFRITPYVPEGLKKRHFLLIPGSYDYDNLGVAEQERYIALREKLTADCRHVGQKHVDFELWLCPPH